MPPLALAGTLTDPADRTISLGKYGAFPSNLIIHRPYHLTYELLDKQADEAFCRLRIVPASELYADIFADEAGGPRSGSQSVILDESDRIISAQDGVEYSLVDEDSNTDIVRFNRETIDDNARQTLTMREIESLKREGTDAGKDLIAKLMLSHTALDQKTVFSLAKYKLLKTKKYIRRFSVLPLDVPMLGNYIVGERDIGTRILEMREEMLALVGCWGNVHYGGDDRFCTEPIFNASQNEPTHLPGPGEHRHGRWLVVDDTGGFLVAAVAERMGLLYPEEEDSADKIPPEAEADGSVLLGRGNGKEEPWGSSLSAQANDADVGRVPSAEAREKDAIQKPQDTASPSARRRPNLDRRDDFEVPYSLTNTITMIHANPQPNLTYLKYYDFDSADPNPPPHPLNNHLLCITWLQLVDPAIDTVYPSQPPNVSQEELASWKPAHRGNYHRKRRRWTRTRHSVDSTRAGGFSGLVVASTMDPISVLRYAVPLLAGGAPIAIYSPALEPLTALADCYSIARRSAWTSDSPPPELAGRSADELERWEGSDDFPLNPTLVLGAAVQTSRTRKWQVLPGRTHPLMTARGGAEGYVFTGWKVLPAKGGISARGTFQRRKARAAAPATSGVQQEESPVGDA